MGLFDGLWRGRAAVFDSGSAASNAIELTKRHSQVSLTKQEAATGHLRINLTWRMRTSDIGGPQRESLLRHPFKALRPPEVMGHSQSMVNVDLDLGCLYELQDGTKGVVQPLGGYLGDVNAPPYVKLSGDDRFGSGSGETIYVNLDQREAIKRLLVFVYIYDQTPAFDRTHAIVTLYPSNGPPHRDRPGRTSPPGPVLRGRDDREREERGVGAARGEVRLRLPGGAGPVVRVGAPVGQGGHKVKSQR
ncbi:hypothetical protein GCM10020295_58570 [Streptomyces cinereospinus]